MHLIKTKKKFWKAIEDSDLDTVEAYLKSSPSTYLNAGHHIHSSMRPFSYAVRNNRLSIAHLLLRYKADPNDPGDGYYAPLYYAVGTGDTNIVRAILECGANPDKSYALQQAVSRNAKSIVETLLEYKADINNFDEGKALLFRAIDKPDITTLLLKAGADPHALYDGTTTLMYAVYNNSEEVFDLLTNAGMTYNPTYDQDMLYKAVEKDFPESFIKKIATTGSPLTCDRDISLIISNKRYDYLTLIEKLGVDLGKIPDLSLSDMLFKAIKAGDAKIIDHLFDKGIDANACREKQYLLHAAIEANNFPFVKTLVKSGARLDVENAEGLTPYQLARKKKHIDMMELFNNIKEEAVVAAHSGKTHKTGGKEWVSLDLHATASVTVYPQINKKITEIFNFQTRSVEKIYDDLRSKAQYVIEKNFDQIDRATLNAACRAHADFDGAPGDAVAINRPVALTFPSPRAKGVK